MLAVALPQMAIAEETTGGWVMLTELNLPTHGILPESVRYALRYREAKLGREEIFSLLDNGMEHEGLYLFFKAFERDASLQCEVLNDLAHMISDHESGNAAGMIRLFVQRNKEKLPLDFTVSGAKIAQLARQGFTLWYDKFNKMAEMCAADPRQTYIIGYAMFVGLPAFIRSHDRRGKALRILIPSLVLDQESTICGYEINRSARILEKDFPRDHPALIVDDTCHTGACRRKVCMFWRNGMSDIPPHEFIVMDEA